MSESKEMVRGTFLITISILITKVLGVLFIIPFTALIGGQANMAPFTYAYAPYNIAIAIATAGVPLAASKYVAKYNALGAYKVSQKFYKSSFVVMSITGIVGFLVLYLFQFSQLGEEYFKDTNRWDLLQCQKLQSKLQELYLF